MVDLGHFILVFAWLLSAYAFILGVWGAWQRKAAISTSAARALSLSAVMCLAALVALAVLFLKHDYRYAYVWQTSNNEMPWYYLISAVWGGMDGSMLLWAALLGLYAAFAIRSYDDIPQRLSSWVTPVLASSMNFFQLVVVFLTNPFRLIPSEVIPPDGNGLNPLLQNPSMLIHPPMLYCGFTGLVVPFAFCVGALLSGQLGDLWIRTTRRWTLIAWGFLTVGIILGGNWAYIELGWGGFWAWDPVENASFLPWLSATAFLHSVMVQERRGMLKVWNVSLAVLTYCLAVFGTFLTRSGVVQSVHAFAETNVGWVFLVYLGLVAIVFVSGLIFRWSALKSEHHIESYFSREAAFLFNNLALLSICFATLWGVLFPVISEHFTGQKSVVGPPFFNQVNIPLFLSLIFLMGVGPLVSWRRASAKGLFKVALKPFLFGSLITLLFLWLEPTRLYPALSFGLCLFVLMTIAAEMHRGARARKELTKEDKYFSGLVKVVKHRPRKYGGLLVHVGIAVMTIAITASMAYKIEKDVTLLPGEKAEVGRYVLQLTTVKEETFPNYSALSSELKVTLKSGELVTTLHPERRFYFRSKETTAEVDIRMTPREDLYVAFAGSDIPPNVEPEQVDITKVPSVFKVFVNPLQIWLWLGGVIVFAGTLLVVAAEVVVVPRQRRAVKLAAESVQVAS